MLPALLSLQCYSGVSLEIYRSQINVLFTDKISQTTDADLQEICDHYQSTIRVDLHSAEDTQQQFIKRVSMGVPTRLELFEQNLVTLSSNGFLSIVKLAQRTQTVVVSTVDSENTIIRTIKQYAIGPKDILVAESLENEIPTATNITNAIMFSILACVLLAVVLIIIIMPIMAKNKEKLIKYWKERILEEEFQYFLLKRVQQEQDQVYDEQQPQTTNRLRGRLNRTVTRFSLMDVDTLAQSKNDFITEQMRPQLPEDQTSSEEEYLQQDDISKARRVANNSLMQSLSQVSLVFTKTKRSRQLQPQSPSARETFKFDLRKMGSFHTVILDGDSVLDANPSGDTAKPAAQLPRSKLAEAAGDADISVNDLQ